MNSQDCATILIVEDELIVAESLSIDLQRKGYAIAGIASTGAEAINMAFLTQPDVILMDIMLKGSLDGIETSKVIQQQLSVPVIFITAFSDRATLERAQQTQKPFHYLVKPIRLKDLTCRIEEVLESVDSLKAKKFCVPLELNREHPKPSPSWHTAMHHQDMDISIFDINNPTIEAVLPPPSPLFRA